ncbi:hypothetical protein BN1051_02308 [Arthrobacter saudimassiliensis]|uniref:3-methyl-adenine DNA glycosylase II n=1 Tax=Arthrobacter saudimassiliensis TaxID=1461584 RepID=A0A078MVR7_9MICC|nr:hypothetical protein BN1051_02308 [Arthrobacter saudimassiliensis]
MSLPVSALPDSGTGLSALVELPGPYSLGASLAPLAHGRRDPTTLVGADEAWLAFATADGDATLRLAVLPSSGAAVPRTGPAGPVLVRASAWGPGAEAALDRVPRLLGADDDWSGFDDAGFLATLPRLVTETRRRNPGLRLPACGRMLDTLVPVILEQKVTLMEAYSAWRYLVTKFGRPAPGPGPVHLRVAPDAAGWRRVPSWEWHRAGVDSSRSGAVMRACAAASGLERLAEAPVGADLEARLRTVPGIGPWTVAETVQRTHGAPDTVSVGDFHLAKFVGAALTGRRTDDAGMLALLEPWRGHRQRVVRMLMLSGFRKQAYGPKLAPEDHRRR